MTQKASSCIGVFDTEADAIKARQTLLDAGIDESRITLFNGPPQPSEDSRPLSEALEQLGVHEGSAHCYLCLLHNGANLVVVSGSYEEIERAFGVLDAHPDADVALHFNA